MWQHNGVESSAISLRPTSFSVCVDKHPQLDLLNGKVDAHATKTQPATDGDMLIFAVVDSRYPNLKIIIF
jgi:hypothetical protein